MIAEFERAARRRSRRTRRSARSSSAAASPTASSPGPTSRTSRASRSAEEGEALSRAGHADLRPARGLPRAGGGGDPRDLPRRRHRARARLPLPRGLRRPEDGARPARGDAGPPARRGRHAAPAAARRPRHRARPDPDRPRAEGAAGAARRGSSTRSCPAPILLAVARRAALGLADGTPAPERGRASACGSGCCGRSSSRRRARPSCRRRAATTRPRSRRSRS